MKKSLFGLMAIAILTSQSHADLILQYETALVDPLPASMVDIRVSADNLTGGSGVSLRTSGSSFNWVQWGDGSSEFNSFSDAVANGDFWTWGFDVTDSLTLIDLTTMAIELDRSGTGPNQVQIDASINGGTASTLDSFSFGETDDPIARNVNLSGLSQLKNGDSIVFTLAAFGADSGGISTAGTFDLESNLLINGTFSSVPEPSSVAIMSVMGLLTGGILLRRRSLRKAKA